jgi:ABC-type dipeptide/oligopeptide/nickel transport system permease component
MAFLTLVMVATLCFALTKLAGEEAAFGDRPPTPEVRAEIEKKWGLNLPLHEQYLLHMSKLMVLDSMESRIRKNQTLRDVLRDQLPTSLRLGARALILALLLGIPIGVISAVYHNRWLDTGGMLFALVGVSVPSFILASITLYVATRMLSMKVIGWEKPLEVGVNLPGGIQAITDEVLRLRLWIPALCLGAFPFAAILRLTRSSMLDALSQDYVRTARAKGLTPWKVIGVHALRNALTPVVTYVGPVTAGVLTGSLVVEKIFAIPGLGRFFVESVSNRDLPLIMGLTVFYSALLIFMNLLVDAVYPILNPRLRR